ncbi:MAG: hypothetical protein C0490_09235 [Marivirga sp.]|nr:hypothetical protein [Marivirga sp.]
MGYQLHGLIGFSNDMKFVCEKWNHAKVVPLTDETALIPMTSVLFDEMNNGDASPAIGKFELLTIGIENTILKLFNNTKIAYVEADYFGGMGVQSGIVWWEGKRVFEKELQGDVINEILRYFGVVKISSMDEFDSVRLGRFRSTDRWG